MTHFKSLYLGSWGAQWCHFWPTIYTWYYYVWIHFLFFVIQIDYMLIPGLKGVFLADGCGVKWWRLSVSKTCDKDADQLHHSLYSSLWSSLFRFVWLLDILFPAQCLDKKVILGNTNILVTWLDGVVHPDSSHRSNTCKNLSKIRYD